MIHCGIGGCGKFIDIRISISVTDILFLTKLQKKANPS
jgi:hypothetical protein